VNQGSFRGGWVTALKKGAPLGVGCDRSHHHLRKSTLVNDEKHIGLDVHQATIVVAVMVSGSH